MCFFLIKLLSSLNLIPWEMSKPGRVSHVTDGMVSCRERPSSPCRRGGSEAGVLQSAGEVEFRHGQSRFVM